MPIPPPNIAQVIEGRGVFQKALEHIAPSYALRRLQSTVHRHLFSYQAAYGDRLLNPKRIERPEESHQGTYERHTLMIEARDLVKNFALMAGIPQKIALHCVPREWSANTGDKAYDQEVNDYFHDWCAQCDVSGRHSFRQLMGLALQMHFVDGDCGFAERSTGDGLRIQLYPADLIGNPNESNAGDKGYFDGIFINPATGGPSQYRVYKRTREGSYQDPEDIALQHFHHLYDPFRVDQWRGVSAFHACMRDARMLQGILEAEQVGVRFASQQAALVFNERASASARDAFVPTALSSTTLPNGQTQQDELSDVGLIKYLSQGDKVQIMPGRPSSAFQGFVDHLMNQIAIGVGCPAAVLFSSAGYKGPNVRAEFAAADRFFESKRYVLVSKAADPIRMAAILDGIANDRLRAPDPRKGESPTQALLRACRGEWRWPAKSTIDNGRDSAAALNEHRQGVMSGQKIAADNGYDYYQALEEKIAAAKYIQERCKAEGIPESAVQLFGNSLPSTPAAAAAVGSEVGDAAAIAQADSVNASPAADNVIAASFSTLKRFPAFLQDCDNLEAYSRARKAQLESVRKALRLN